MQPGETFDQRVKRLVDEELARKETTEPGQEQTQDPAAAQPTPSPWEVEVNGEKRTFATPGELQSFLAAQQQANTQAAQQAGAAAAHQVGQRVTAADMNRDPFQDPEKRKEWLENWAKTMQQDPRQAAAMIDQARGLPADWPNRVAQLAGVVQEQNQKLALMEWRAANPDFPGTDEAVSALGKVMESYRLPITPQGLDMAYAVALKNGWVQNTQQQQAAQPQQEQVGPPRVGRGSAGYGDGGQDWYGQVENMSPDQILSVINSLGGQ